MPNPATVLDADRPQRRPMVATFTMSGLPCLLIASVIALTGSAVLTHESVYVRPVGRQRRMDPLERIFDTLVGPVPSRLTMRAALYPAERKKSAITCRPGPSRGHDAKTLRTSQHLEALQNCHRRR
jgi:hypothetical protein